MTIPPHHDRPILLPVGLLLTALLSGTACVRAPNVVYMVDEKTALERQASGELRPLEEELINGGLSPSPATFTQGRLIYRLPPPDYEASTGLGQLFDETQSDEARLNALLVRRCVGEALTGLLEETPDTCTGAQDAAEFSWRVEQANRNRRQLWAWLMSQQPGASEETVRVTWRRYHLEALVCGGQVQQPDGTWGIKGC